MDENEVLVLKGDSTTLSTGRKRWPQEKSRKLFILWYWYMYYDGSQCKDIINIYIYMKYLMIKYWWVTSYEFVVRIICLKGLFPHPNVSEFHLLSISPPSPLFPLRPRLGGGNEMEWKWMIRIILEYSSLPMFGSFNGGNGKLIPLFGSLSRREWNE